MPDERIAYGAHCMWWDSIHKVGKTPPSASGISLPCCPRCGKVLLEVPNEASWWHGVDMHEQRGHPGYRKFMEWCRGKCFLKFDEAVAAYKAEGGKLE